MRRIVRKSYLNVLSLLSLTFFLIITIGFQNVKASTQVEGTDEYCLSCHGEKDLSLTLEDGKSISVFVSPDSLDHSIHDQKGIECTACHRDIQKYPHAKVAYKDQRDLSVAFYKVCEECHSANYAKTQDSIHAKAFTNGDLSAPICTDCHGSHEISGTIEPRSKISSTCGNCHTAIYDAYAKSVHGSALINDNNPDVPVCTDCHGVHNIQDARSTDFRVQSPELCAKCHANKELMAKYGLSSDVYSIYKTSWHGVDVSVYKAKWPTIWHDSAVCTDCHGVHDMLKTADSNSKVNPKNLLKTCQQCHPDAGPNWTGAWTGHNKISLDRTPWLFYVDAFYSSFAPIVLWGSAIYVLLQLIRQLVDRIRRQI